MWLFTKLRKLFAAKVERPGNPVQRTSGKITRYGYANDETPDSLTEAGWGAFGNKLTRQSLAISRDVEASFRAAGIKPLDLVEIFVEDRPPVIRRWEDRTAKSYKGKALVGRFDIYDPDNKYKQLDGKPVVGFRKA